MKTTKSSGAAIHPRHVTVLLDAKAYGLSMPELKQ